MYIDDAERLRRNTAVRSLVAQLEAKREGAADHAARVAVYASATAFQLDPSIEDLFAVRWASELHEFGEGLKDAVDGDRFLEPCIPLVDALREEWNGAGSPYGLAGTRIPLGARIVAVADAFDEATMPVGAEGTLPEAEAIQLIRQGIGRAFDPQVVLAFLKVQRIVQPVGL